MKNLNKFLVAGFVVSFCGCVYAGNTIKEAIEYTDQQHEEIMELRNKVDELKISNLNYEAEINNLKAYLE